jgi:hypothetical protein
LLYIDGLLRRSFKVRNVTLGLTPGHCPLLGHLKDEDVRVVFNNK